MSEKGARLPWADEVDPDHYDDAFDYLSLHWSSDRAREAVDALKEAAIIEHLPGDILRAAISPAGGPVTLLPWDDPGLRRELIRILDGGQIKPILCVNLQQGIVIADGFHRTSLAYHVATLRKMPLKLA